MKQNRRDFLKAGTVATVGLAALASCSISGDSNKNIPNGLTVLFQGDSITDAKRNKRNQKPNNGEGLGTGYAFIAGSKLVANNPDKGIIVHNRGISGNKVYQLADRWVEDMEDIKPDVLSILIGVNDYWHFVNGKYNGTIQKYTDDYRALLDRSISKFPDIKLLICEPFVVWGGRAITDRWKNEYPAYMESSATLCKEFGATFVSFQSMFEKALKTASAEVWCPDGVHPSPAGAHLMANLWLEKFDDLF